MIVFFLMILIVSTLEIIALKRKQNNRVLVAYIILTIVTMSLGYFYFTKSSNDSLAKLFFKISKISY